MDTGTDYVALTDEAESDGSFEIGEPNKTSFLFTQAWLPSKHSRQRLPYAPPTFSELVSTSLENVVVPTWQPAGRRYPQPSTLMLHEEILDFVRHIEPSEEEHHLRQCVVGSVIQILRDDFYMAKTGGFNVTSFGSYETQLYLPNGDIDLSVVFDTDPTHTQVLHWIELIGSSLKNSKQFTNIELVRSAKVPIVKAVHKEIGIPIDISVQQLNGKRAVERVFEFMQMHKSLRPLLFVLKMFFSSRGLLDVYSGGISSYSLIIMIQCFLSSHLLISRRVLQDSENLGVLLIEWFELFGKFFDHYKTSITKDGFRPKEIDRYTRFHGPANINPQFLSIIDPNDSGNDLARGSRCAEEIIRAIRWAHDFLIETVLQCESGKAKAKTILGNLFQISPNLVLYRNRMLEKSQAVHRQIEDEEKQERSRSSLPGSTEACNRKRSISYAGIDTDTEPPARKLPYMLKSGPVPKESGSLTKAALPSRPNASAQPERNALPLRDPIVVCLSDSSD